MAQRRAAIHIANNCDDEAVRRELADHTIDELADKYDTGNELIRAWERRWKQYCKRTCRVCGETKRADDMQRNRTNAIGMRCTACPPIVPAPRKKSLASSTTHADRVDAEFEGMAIVIELIRRPMSQETGHFNRYAPTSLELDYA
jgi:MoaA/NifB/PqqE/SkfB family radical SAM enzyme